MTPSIFLRAASGISAIFIWCALMGCGAGAKGPPTLIVEVNETALPATTAPPAEPTATLVPSLTPSPSATITSTPLPKGSIALYPDRERQTIRAVGGGNFIHWPHNTAAFEAVSELNLQILSPLIVRARMSLDLWEPQNDDPDPNHIQESGLLDEGPNRYTFEMLKRFQQEGKEIVVSAWDVPDWMVDFPDLVEQRTIQDAMLPEAAETITAWLKHARDRYGVDVSYISFNEADIGAHIQLSADEYAQLIRVTAPRLEAEGIAARWLLADSASMGNALSYARAIWAHEDIRPFLGPLAFHSWDATILDAKLQSLGDFAQREGLEVWCTEAGHAAFLWQRPEEFPTWKNGLSLAAVYLRVLKLTRATTMLYWEMMAQDYPLNDGQQPYLAMHAIRMLQEHFPAGSVILETSEDPPDIKWTGARLPQGGFAVVLLNRGSKSQELTILGLPQGNYEVQTLSANGPEQAPDVSSVDAVMPLTISAESILFLKTR